MNNKPSRERPERLTTEEVEAALHAALRDEGRLFPKTDEDIAALEESLDLTTVPTPDAEGFLAKLREQRESKIKPMTSCKQGVEAASENLAMAARNGKSISDAIRQKMDKLRGQYEQGNQSSGNGTC